MRHFELTNLLVNEAHLYGFLFPMIGMHPELVSEVLAIQEKLRFFASPPEVSPSESTSLATRSWSCSWISSACREPGATFLLPKQPQQNFFPAACSLLISFKLCLHPNTLWKLGMYLCLGSHWYVSKIGAKIEKNSLIGGLNRLKKNVQTLQPILELTPRFQLLCGNFYESLQQTLLSGLKGKLLRNSSSTSGPWHHGFTISKNQFLLIECCRVYEDHLVAHYFVSLTTLRLSDNPFINHCYCHISLCQEPKTSSKSRPWPDSEIIPSLRPLCSTNSERVASALSSGRWRNSKNLQFLAKTGAEGAESLWKVDRSLLWMKSKSLQ